LSLANLDATSRAEHVVCDEGPMSLPDRSAGREAGGLHTEVVPVVSARRIFAGRYVVRAELGRGGMGRVLLARDERLSRDVVAKILQPGPHDEKQLKRFAQEARRRFAESREHPRCARRWHARRGSRDIKPENLFITTERTVKILDFGIARLPRESGEERLSAGTGAVLGTVSYMSPEQVRGKDLDARSDLFSFGSVLYEMLSGRRPFERTTALDTGHAIIAEAPLPLPAHVPAGVAAIVRQCLEKAPQERYASARQLVEALSTVSHGDIPRARELGTPGLAREACPQLSPSRARLRAHREPGRCGRRVPAVPENLERRRS
jgi:serine/threonine protein kinase